MRKIILMLLLGCLMLSCSSNSPANIEVHKLSPQEALAMVKNGKVMIVDTRSEGEFNYEGHIENAVLLPEEEITLQAKETLNQSEPVLVYSRSAVRSEASAIALAKEGYDVYDIGVLRDWPGEVIGSWHYSNYYNAPGNGKPADIVTPIDYTVKRRINAGMPEYSFRLTGENITKYDISSGNDMYRPRQWTHVGNILITDADNRTVQEISGLHTTVDSKAIGHYGLSFDDWNFDGYLDISLLMTVGGSIRNMPSYYWLWTPEAGQFVENEELEEISMFSTLSLNYAEKLVEYYSRAGATEFGYRWYACENGAFIKVRSEYHMERENMPGNIWDIVVEELVDGEMVVTGEYEKDDR